MALVLANRVQETATANTTVSFTLTGAIAGFQTFAVVGDTNTTYYSATDSSNNWEVGLGTYSTTGPTLTRTTIYASSNSNLAVTFSGTVNVFVTYPSGRSVNLDANGNVSALGTVASGTWQGSTVGVAYGGTGVTTSSGANSVMLRDANQNVAVNRLNQSNTDTSAAGGTTALTAASSYSQTLTGTGNQTYTMPDATTLTTGVAFVFNNNATGTLTLQDYATGSIGTITSGGACELVLLNNGTTAGTWDVHGFLPENVTWGTNALNLGSTVISGGTWQGGTIQPAYGGTGLTTFTGANRALYSTGATTLTAGTLPVAAGGTGIGSGTAGGVPYFVSNSAITSSGLLANNDIMLGGGIGGAPKTTTTGSGVVSALAATANTNNGLVTQTGTLTSGALLRGNGATNGISSITTGTGVLTALGVNTGTAGAFVVNGGALGTPSSGTVTNLTGTASININGTVGATTPNTGAFTTISATGVTTVQAGTATAPAITTSGDTNTGIFFPAADTIAFSEGGVEALRITSASNVQLQVANSQILNNSGRPILNQTGSILQVVQNSTVGNSSTTSTTAVDVTNFTVTITPSSTSSKILIIASALLANTLVAATNVTYYQRLVRTSTNLVLRYLSAESGGGGLQAKGSLAISYVDSPATTSATTYKIQHYTSSASSTVYCEEGWIIAMEISG